MSSFFLQDANAPERDFRLALGQCENCGTIQIMEPVPHDALVPPYDWLFAREPEEHLDEVVDQIVALPGVGPQQRDRRADLEGRHARSTALCARVSSEPGG